MEKLNEECPTCASIHFSPIMRKTNNVFVPEEQVGIKCDYCGNEYKNKHSNNLKDKEDILRSSVNSPLIGLQKIATSLSNPVKINNY